MKDELDDFTPFERDLLAAVNKAAERGDITVGEVTKTLLSFFVSQTSVHFYLSEEATNRLQDTIVATVTSFVAEEGKALEGRGVGKA